MTLPRFYLHCDILPLQGRLGSRQGRPASRNTADKITHRREVSPSSLHYYLTSLEKLHLLPFPGSSAPENQLHREVYRNLVDTDFPIAEGNGHAARADPVCCWGAQGEATSIPTEKNSESLSHTEASNGDITFNQLESLAVEILIQYFYTLIHGFVSLTVPTDYGCLLQC